MSQDKLIRMANEIARNLCVVPGEQGVSAVAEHLRSFWTPGMRTTLIAHARAGGAGLTPAALQAARLLGDRD